MRTDSHSQSGKYVGCSTLDKQRICVNTQLKSSKKQLKWNVCVPKSNSIDRYAITCDVNAYHLVHFVSIQLINKYQSGIDFIFTCERAIYSSFMKISVPSPVFRGKTLMMKVKLCKVYTCSNVNKGMRFASGTIKCASLILKKGRRWEWINMQAHSWWLHAIRKGVITAKKHSVKKYENTHLFLQVRNWG